MSRSLRSTSFCKYPSTGSRYTTTLMARVTTRAEGCNFNKASVVNMANWCTDNIPILIHVYKQFNIKNAPTNRTYRLLRRHLRNVCGRRTFAQLLGHVRVEAALGQLVRTQGNKIGSCVGSLLVVGCRT
jgi:hypothetical protein